jgi:hypothetical protein
MQYGFSLRLRDEEDVGKPCIWTLYLTEIDRDGRVAIDMEHKTGARTATPRECFAQAERL